MPPSSDPVADNVIASGVAMGDTATPMVGLVLGILVIAVLVLNAFAY
jgi:hypothetical protein